MPEVLVQELAFDSPEVGGLLAEWNEELGFTPKGGSTVEAADFALPFGLFVVALSEGTPVGCCGLRRMAPMIGEVKRLFVRPAARGCGVGRTLLDGLERRAVERGIESLRLDTDGGVPAALSLFRSAGYKPIADYNGNPFARYWFEKRLADPSVRR